MNKIDYYGKFVKIVRGHHAGKSGYVSLHQGSMLYVQQDQNGRIYEIVTNTYDIETSEESLLDKLWR